MDVLSILNKINSFLWGWPLLIILLGTGVYLTLKLGFIQISKLPMALKLIFTAENEGEGDVSSFGALCTALAATVGTGNIVGVATAIAIGGPGALFWLWVAAFVGMATKYAEGVLAIKYRTIDENGEIAGGPMFYIMEGLNIKWLAIFFSISGVLASLLGIGTLSQVNAITSNLNSLTGVAPQVISIMLAVIVGVCIVGGIKNISLISAKIVPFMATFYIAACVIILVLYYKEVPSAFALIFTSAFTGHSMVGGFSGALMKDAISKGVARGVFSNESGLGSAPIAAAAAKTKYPAEQGLISMTGTFIDSIIICTLTGLTLVVTGMWKTEVSAELMTQRSFAVQFGAIGGVMVSVCLILFAFTTILGWSYYGERCAVFIWGVKSIKFYKIAYIFMVAIGGFLQMELIWIIADICNALMAFPNLIALLLLSPVIFEETRFYLNLKKSE